jgi:hypothetical protein
LENPQSIFNPHGTKTGVHIHAAHREGQFLTPLSGKE